MSLAKNQILNDSRMNSALDGFGVMRPKNKGTKKEILAGLTLTSLVDCFTILVVYLLVTTSMGGQEINTPKDIHLPASAQSDLLEAGVTLNYTDHHFTVNDKPIAMDQLVDTLKSLKSSSGQNALIIQADKKAAYSDLNPAVLSGLQAGFEKIRFAVLKENE